MTDARQEDQDRIVGQPVIANRVGTCAASPICKDKILEGDLIVQVDGNWVHSEGSCVDDLETVLAERRAESFEAVMVRSLLVCGSRSWDQRGPILSALQRIEPNVVIEGGARGADRHARIAARALGLHVATVEADWDRHGKAAGPARNAAMLALKPDLVLAFWDGSSPGTAHMVRIAERAGVPVEVMRS